MLFDNSGAARSRQSRVALARVVADWAAGRLTGVWRDPDVEGLAGILIDCAEILEKSERVFSGDPSLLDAAARLRISIGSIRLLRDCGYLKQVKLRNPDTQHYRYYITEESIQAFEKHYVTLGQMAEQFEIAAIHLGPALDRREVETIPCEAGFVRAYPNETRDVVQEMAMGGKTSIQTDCLHDSWNQDKQAAEKGGCSVTHAHR